MLNYWSNKLMMPKIRQLFFNLHIILITIFIFSETVYASLHDKAVLQGSIRVIVGLNMPYQAEGKLSSVQAVMKQQALIAQTQKTIINNLSVHNIRHIKSFSTMPFMSMKVDSHALKALENNPTINIIEEDKPSPPALNQSVPYINADDIQNQGYDGTGWTVAILDTGIRTSHEFLDSGKIVSEACYSTTDAGYNSSTLCPNGQSSQIGAGASINCNINITGCHHGTHVAGIAAGNNGSLVNNGVASGANIIAIQIFSSFENSSLCDGSTTPCALSYDSDQLSALERVYELRNTYNIAAVNMSIGGNDNATYCDSAILKTAIDNLRAAGIATVISAGNSGLDGSVGYPGCISSAITVGATLDNQNTIAYYSNHASMVDLMAPGSSITSAVAHSDSSYDVSNGTSMAAPHVTGAFALMRSKNSAWSVTEIETLLETSGVDVTRGDITKPRIDLLAALASVALPPIISAPNPEDGARITPASSGQHLKVTAPNTDSAVIYYDSESSIVAPSLEESLSHNVIATINGDDLEVTIPYSNGEMSSNGTNFWYVEASNNSGTTRYPEAGNLSFTVVPPPVISDPEPEEGITIIAGDSGQKFTAIVSGSSSAIVFYDDDSVNINHSVVTPINDNVLEVTIPYSTEQLSNNGTNSWYIEASNDSGTTRYPESGSLSFTVIPPPPVISDPYPDNNASVIAGSTGQVLSVTAPKASSVTIYYDDDSSDIDYSVIANVNEGIFSAIVPYQEGKMASNGPNYWYIEASNSSGTTRYPLVGNITFSVTPPLLASDPKPEDGLTFINQSTEQALAISVPYATSGIIYYGDNVTAEHSITASINADSLYATIPYFSGEITRNGTNYWYIEASNKAETIRYPSTGSLSFTVKPTINIVPILQLLLLNEQSTGLIAE